MSINSTNGLQKKNHTREKAHGTQRHLTVHHSRNIQQLSTPRWLKCALSNRDILEPYLSIWHLNMAEYFFRVPKHSNDVDLKWGF